MTGSSLFPSNYPSISAKPVWKARPYSGNTRPGTSLMATASSAVVSDDIADVLGVVGILTASGEPVKFRDLWDQQELPFPVDILCADPDRKAYDVLGLYYGLGRTFFNPASICVHTESFLLPLPLLRCFQELGN